MAGGALELVFACSDANATCRPGEVCACRGLQVNPDPYEVGEMATWARGALPPGALGVRCARPDLDNATAGGPAQ